MSTPSFCLGSLACEVDLTITTLVNVYADPSLTKVKKKIELENDSSSEEFDFTKVNTGTVNEGEDPGDDEGVTSPPLVLCQKSRVEKILVVSRQREAILNLRNRMVGQLMIFLPVISKKVRDEEAEKLAMASLIRYFCFPRVASQMDGASGDVVNDQTWVLVNCSNAGALRKRFWRHHPASSGMQSFEASVPNHVGSAWNDSNLERTYDDISRDRKARSNVQDPDMCLYPLISQKQCLRQ
eukprot:gene17057-biopygen539